MDEFTLIAVSVGIIVIFFAVKSYYATRNRILHIFEKQAHKRTGALEKKWFFFHILKLQLDGRKVEVKLYIRVRIPADVTIIFICKEKHATDKKIVIKPKKTIGGSLFRKKEPNSQFEDTFVIVPKNEMATQNFLSQTVKEELMKIHSLKSEDIVVMIVPQATIISISCKGNEDENDFDMYIDAVTTIISASYQL